MTLREQENVFLFEFRLIVPAVLKCLFVHVPNFCCFFLGGGEDQGRRTGVAVTPVSNSSVLGGWVTKVLKRMVTKIGGGGGGWKGG